MRSVKFLLALMLMLSTTLTASAESVAERAGYEAFKRLVEMNSVDVDCVSKFQLIFHSPYAHSELRARGLEIPAEKFDFNNGSFEVDIAAAGKMISFDAPFYVVEDGKNFEVYFMWDDKWKKISAPDDELKDIIKQDVEKKWAMVNRAVLLGEDDTQQIVGVEFDAVKFAEHLEIDFETKEEQPATEEAKWAAQFKNYLRDALIETKSINATYGIDKATGRALMIEIDLSEPLMHFLSALAGNETAIKYGASELLGAFASTSSLKLYGAFDYAGPFDRKEFQLPKKVKKAEDITAALMSTAKTENKGTR